MALCIYEPNSIIPHVVNSASFMFLSFLSRECCDYDFDTSVNVGVPCVAETEGGALLVA